MSLNNFSVKVKPLVPASEQANGDYSNNDVVADWTAFDVPKGGGILKAITAKLRGSAIGASDFILLFAEPSADGTAPTTLGAGHAAIADIRFSGNLVGAINIDKNSQIDYGGKMTIYSTGGGGGGDQIPNFNLFGNPRHTNDGSNTLYVACLQGPESGVFNFTSQVFADGAITLNDTSAGFDNGSGGADPSAEAVFAPGDILHDSSDNLIATIDSIAAFAGGEQVITFTGGAAALADGQQVFNINPIEIILHFQK